jgi:hypothetical protein
MQGQTDREVDVEQLQNVYEILVLPLLSSVVQNRNKRKAKLIVNTGIEFLLAVGSLLSAIKAEYGDNREPLGAPLGVVVMIYVAALVAFVSYHAYQLPSESYTTIEVEEAYKKTNSMPIIGGVLEIPLALKFGGAEVVFTLWTIFALISAALVYLLVAARELLFLLPSFLVWFTLYDLTSEVSEYWVFTHHRPQQLKKDLVLRPSSTESEE